jgi:ankyrin repeat protein
METKVLSVCKQFCNKSFTTFHPSLQEIVEEFPQLDDIAYASSTDNETTISLVDAVYEGHVDSVLKLLRTGIDVNAADLCGVTPLNWAVRKGNIEMV